MGMGKEKDIFDDMSLILLMYNISQNGIKFARSKSKELTNIRECYYLLKIYYSEIELSQEDLCDIFCQSKGTVAKTLRKLEDKGYIERIINKDNRRKYILKLTKKGEEVIPVLKREADYWHNSVGLAKISDEYMAVIRDVARKSYNLVND
ncbi:MarR family winged helix-turn-helix transcriptional regulator [Methanobrevibacter smithii]|uniref:MarR family winged helix-turn-helix transcriptional regulator n=1 Tax=Methanobrevibacter smithii TaxID=2173 RepID=UPI0003751242|nr:MarR family transcriptional regulator [Methanobrevibacter smithii]MDY5217601.1 MarR family transcriptional regulator [Methanobrevibacter smithii]